MTKLERLYPQYGQSPRLDNLTQAKLAFRLFRERFSGERWQRLVGLGPALENQTPHLGRR